MFACIMYIRPILDSISNQTSCFEPTAFFPDSAFLDIMGRSGSSGSANTNQNKGRSTNGKALSARNKASTSNSDNLETSDFSPEQMALYKAMHTQLASRKKVATAGQDQGMSTLILEGCSGS